MSQRSKSQHQWNDFGLDDLRSLPLEDRVSNPAMIEEAQSQSEAVQILINEFGLDHEHDIKEICTPIGYIEIDAKHLGHIVEKRRDARERYIKYAISTINNPFEVWESQYENGTTKLQFIGTYTSKYQMLVVVARHETHTLWNYMQIDAKKLNKHRSGRIIYQRKRVTE